MDHLKSFTVNFVMSLVRSISVLIWGEEPLLEDTQIKLIRSSWQKVEKGNLQESGLILFKRLFKIAPYLRDLFPFGYKPDGLELRTHALGVMETVGVAVKNLDNPSVLRAKLLELGNAHKQYELTDKEYKNVGAALLWTLDQGLGDAFTPDTKNAWTAAYGFIHETMKAGSNQ